MPDRHEAADWYRRVLGLHVVPGFEQWAANPRGPLMIATAGRRHQAGAFRGAAAAIEADRRIHRVAFRVDADGFLAFVRRLDDHPVQDHQGRPVTADAVVDHDVAYSIYFCDPYGHHLEVTTYEHEEARTGLR